MEKTSAHIETYPDVPPRVFAKHVEMQKQQDDKCFSIDDTDKVFRTVRVELIIEQSSHKDQ